MSGPLLMLAGVLLLLGYALIYTGASLGTNWETSFQKALLGGLKFAGSTA